MERPRPIAALLPNVRVRQLQILARFFKEMLKQTPAKVLISDHANGQDGSIRSVAPAALINPNQALGRRVARATTPQRKSGKRTEGSRKFKRRVLIVDDVADVTEMIGLFLKHAGYEVALADSAPAALRMAQERAFDLIISDIGMPEMNGYELAETLRRRAEYQGIPIIAVTGYSEYDDRGRALQAGFNAHLTKPIDPAELLLLMNELLG
jgi:CheY-like chemotaxis protein